ncbi:MAG: hypothetical protein ACLFV5_05825 [Anaerolineales bacterium]
MMITKILVACTILAALITALGYGLGGLWIGALMSIAVGSLWLLGQRRDWPWIAPLALVCFVGAAMVALWLGLAPGLFLLGVVLALSAWDLDHFARRVNSVGRIEEAHHLRRRHMGRLVAVNASSLIFGGAALAIEIQLDFYIILLLALLAVVGLSQSIRFLQSGGD